MFSPDDFLKQIDERRVYYFSSQQLNTEDPHYFICITKTDHDNLMAFVCCTTQFEKRAKFHEISGYPGTCLVRIKSTPENGLTKESYVDCTRVFQFTGSEFKTKYQNGSLVFKGSLEEVYFEQILIGVKDSPTTDPRMCTIAEEMIKALYL
ncbi:MAG: hypothetical protein WDO14_21510 [Bacteroidota bacterium]